MNSIFSEHVADLRRSGFTDEVIERLGIESVRPHDIKIQGVQSAYRIPYWELSGEKNCFERWRLCPPVETKDGKRKYHQEKDSDSHVYLPPLVSWEEIARDVTQPVLGAEGEKKSAAACLKGLPTLGFGGLWNWRQKLQNGDRLVIPTLDLFQWHGREVFLVPDSDCWRESRLVELLQGFFALAQELIARGARVEFVRLPDKDGVKQGLDDWLVAVGNEWETLWPHLERIALDDARLKAVAAWWQRWRERKATEEAVKAQDQEELELQEAAGLYTVLAPKHGVQFSFDRLANQRNKVHAEVTIVLGATELLSGIDLGLMSDNAQTTIARSLTTFSKAIPWKFLLQRSCAMVLRRYRTGDPATVLDQDSVIQPLAYHVNPLVFQKKVTVVYADGGLAKSTTTLLLAMCVSTGASVAGFHAVPGKSLYLDWEDDADVHARRLQAIQAAHPELKGARVSYQRCIEPLALTVHQLVRHIQHEKVTFVVVDSLLAATGGDSSAEATTKLFVALRMLNVSVLVIGHVPKSQGEGQDHPTVYGSVFNQNFARSVWEVKKEQAVGEDSLVLGLFNRKSNLSRLHHPIGLKVFQNEDSSRIRFDPYDLNETAELEESLPVASRIRNLLEDGELHTSKDISEALSVKLSVVKYTLSKHRDRKWVMIGENRDAKWTILNR